MFPSLTDEYLKGVATEAGKATWQAVKSLFGWTSDPQPHEIPEKVASALTESEQLVTLLKNGKSGESSEIVRNVQVSGGKVVFAHTINTSSFTF